MKVLTTLNATVLTTDFTRLFILPVTENFRKCLYEKAYLRTGFGVVNKLLTKLLNNSFIVVAFFVRNPSMLYVFEVVNKLLTAFVNRLLTVNNLSRSVGQKVEKMGVLFLYKSDYIKEFRM